MDDSVQIMVATGLSIIVILILALGFAVLFVFRQQAREQNEISEDLKSYRGMALEAIGRYQDLSEQYLIERGLPLPLVLADVVAEHNSPSTRRQAAAASLATQRARLTAINRALEAASKPKE